MNKEIVPFNYQSQAVRTCRDQSGEVWFVAADVCKVLELNNVSQALSRLDDDEKDNIITNDVMGRTTSLATVSEPGLYSLILTSRKPEAKAFKRWITHEVLPAIRKTGAYSVTLTPAQQLLQMAQAMVEHEQRMFAVEAEQRALVARVERVEMQQGGSEYFTVLGYCRVRGQMMPTLAQAAAIGRKAAQLSRDRGLPTGKANDPRFGEVGTYHISILDEIFKG
jgi:prophage antirepressor-like protein